MYYAKRTASYIEYIEEAAAKGGEAEGERAMPNNGNLLAENLIFMPPP